MRLRFLSALVLAGVALLAPAAAQAVTVKADATVRLATISSKGTPPAPGSSSTSAGTVSRGALGRGAITSKLTFGENLSFTGSTRSFFAAGTVAGTLKGSAKGNPDGSVTFSGSGTFTGGTGRFRGAKGKFSFTGTLPSGAQVTTLQVKGSIKYPG